MPPHKCKNALSKQPSDKIFIGCNINYSSCNICVGEIANPDRRESKYNSNWTNSPEIKYLLWYVNKCFSAIYFKGFRRLFHISNEENKLFQVKFKLAISAFKILITGSTNKILKFAFNFPCSLSPSLPFLPVISCQSPNYKVRAEVTKHWVLSLIPAHITSGPSEDYGSARQLINARHYPDLM